MAFDLPSEPGGHRGGTNARWSQLTSGRRLAAYVGALIGLVGLVVVFINPAPDSLMSNLKWILVVAGLAVVTWALLGKQRSRADDY